MLICYCSCHKALQHEMSKAHSMAKLAESWTSEFPGFLLFILQSLQASLESKSYVVPKTELGIQNPSP